MQLEDFIAGTTKQRCQGITKAETQCRKAAVEGEHYCVQHGMAGAPREVARAVSKFVDEDSDDYADPIVHKAAGAVVDSVVQQMTQPKGKQQFLGLVRRKPVSGIPVGITPVERGQMVQSPRHASRKAKRTAKRNRVLNARGNRRSA